MIVLIAAKDILRFSALAARLRRQQEIELVIAATGASGFLILKSRRIDLAIVDEQLDDMSGLTFVRQLVKRNPMVNTAIVSALTEEKFHEATEGLGVLMQLPMQPQGKNAEALLAILEKIGVLLQPSVQKPREVTKS